VITMEMLGKIRRMHLRDKLSLHEIAKRTGLSRNTVRAWLRKPDPKAPPKYQRRAIPPKLGPFRDSIVLALKADSHRPRHERRTAKALFEQIRAAGYTGCYAQVTKFVREWREQAGKAPHAFVPLRFELGDAFQFDWSEEGLVVGGVYRKLQVAHMKLCASRAFWLVAYPSQGHEMLFDAHARALAPLARQNPPPLAGSKSPTS
jgi:transposase